MLNIRKRAFPVIKFKCWILGGGVYTVTKFKCFSFTTDSTSGQIDVIFARRAILWLWKPNRKSLKRLGFLRCQRKVTFEIQNRKISKKKWTYFTTHIWLKTTSITLWNVNIGFFNRDLVQLRKINFFSRHYL